MTPALLLAGALQAARSPPAAHVAPAVTAFVTAVHQAYAKVRAAQAKAPARTDRQRLERLLELDQAGREPLAQLDSDHMTKADRRAAQPALAEIAAQDLADREQLKAMIPRSGWFTRKVYGRKAALAAWLVAEHAPDDPALIRLTLARLKPSAASGGFEGREYAIMYDRVAVMLDHRPQRYGTQVTCQGGAWRAVDVEDAARLDQRRRAAGFAETEAEYLKGFSDPCR